jgi:hypothetical protein
MTAKIIDGKALAATVKGDVAARVRELERDRRKRRGVDLCPQAG